MDKTSVFLFVLLIFSALSQSPSGVKVILTQQGLNHARDVGLQVIRREVQNLRVSDQSGRTKVPVLGDVEWWVNEIKIHRIDVPTGVIVASPNGLIFSL